MRACRRWRAGRRAVGLVGLGCLLALLGPEQTAARETRAILDGRYELTVGFLQEPAFEGEPNGLYLRVREVPPPTAEAATATLPAATAEAAAAETPTPPPGAELTVEVTFGEEVLPLTLQETGQPGLYQAFFVPTQPGDYLFHIGGKIAGEEIAEVFGPGRGIPAVIGVEAIQFPREIPAGQGLVDALTERDEETDRVRTLVIVGVLFGVVGLFGGGLAVVLSRRPPTPAPAPHAAPEPADPE